MWVFLSEAMLSIVEDRDDPAILLVRARRLEDLVRAFRDLEPISSPEADYPWRIKVPRAAIAKLLVSAVNDLHYDNFKNSGKDHARQRIAGNR